METKICQSCGMPMTEEEQFGKNADGSLNSEYCCYCFSEGSFTKEETMEEMIESCIPFMLGEEFPNAEVARASLKVLMPKLKRWQQA